MKLGIWSKYRTVFVTYTALALILGESGKSALPAQEPHTNFKTFADWCKNLASLTPEAKYTVEVLLNIAEADTTECDAANQKLSTLTRLYLSRNEISDIKPLESLTRLTWLSLNNNQISDIKPLESLTRLIFLFLQNNQISDIKPLESLTNLTDIYLSGNPIANKTCPLNPESICKWEPKEL